MVFWVETDSLRQWSGTMKWKAKSKGLRREKRASRGHRVGVIRKWGKLSQGQSKGIFKKVGTVRNFQSSRKLQEG